MKRIALCLIPILIQAGVIVPEFVVTEGVGSDLSHKDNLSGHCSSQGKVVLAWLDWREGGKTFPGFDEYPQPYVQCLDNQGVPQGDNYHLSTGGNFLDTILSPSAVVFDDGAIITASGVRGEDVALALWDSDLRFDGEPVDEFTIPLQLSVLLATDGDDLCVAVAPNSFQRFLRTGELIGQWVSYSQGTCIPQDVLMSSDGSFAIAYAVEDSMFFYSYYYRRYDEEGEPRGEPVFITSTGGGLRLAGDAAGDMLCTWIEGGVYYCRLYSSADSPESNMNEIGAGSDLDAAQGYADQYLAAWCRDDTIFARFIDASGLPQGTSFRINQPGDAAVSSTWVGGSGELYHVAWLGDVTEEQFPTRRIQSRTVLPSGTPGQQHQVSDDEPGVYAEWNEPALTPEGDFFVHWGKEFSQVGFRSSYMHHFNPSGSPTGSVWGSDSFNWVYPALGLDGKLYVSYFTTDEGERHTVWVQRFNQNGSPVGSPLEMGQSTARRCYGTAVAVGKEGDGVVLWEERISTSNVRLWGRLFDSSSAQGKPFVIDSFYNRGCLRIFKFEDGGFLIGSAQEPGGEYMCYLYDSNGNLEKGPFDTDRDSVWGSTQNLFSMACNSDNRFVVTWVLYGIDGIAFQVYDNQGNRIGEPCMIDRPQMGPAKNLIWAGYSSSVAMAPDGRFVICWSELDPAGNLNLWAQLFNKNGEPISAPFQVNDADQWEYSFQISGWRGVSCNNERILFTWLENRRHRGWDVIAKVTDWDFATITEDPAIEHGNVELISPIGPEIVLQYQNMPHGFHARVFDAAGRLVDELHSSQTQGTVSWGESHGHGVYFIKSFEGRGEVYKVVLVR